MPKEVKALQSEASGILEQAKVYKISTSAQYQSAGTELTRIKGVRQQVDELFDPIVRKAHEAHKAALASKKKLTDPLDMAERAIKQSMIAYNREEERKAREIEARLRAEAEEKARKEQEKLLAKAEKALDKGQEEKAEALLEQAEEVIPVVPIIAPPVERVAGVATRKTWKARVTDAQKIPAYFNGMEIRTIKQSALDNIARMTSGQAEIPGVEFYEDVNISARAVS